MRKVKILALSVGLLSCTLLLAKDFWEEKPYTQWSDKEAMEMLMDSPWAQDQTFGTPQYGREDILANPRPGGGAPSAPPQSAPPSSAPSTIRRGDYTVSRQYYVRFQSAAPIRMALARIALLNGRVTEEQAQAYVAGSPFEGKIVIALSVAPGQDRSELDAVTGELLKKHTHLILKKSKKRIYLERYLSPAEAGGTEAFLVFPRQENGQDLIDVKEEEVRLICQLNEGAELNRRFKLKDMVLGGKLEI